MSLMSRKCTVSADTISASADASAANCTQHDDRKPEQLGELQRRAVVDQERAPESAGPRKKCTMFASTVTIGRISAGNSTFLIRLPPEISTFADSSSDEENHVHGRMPQNMNSA